jgi:hypothetical protein
MTARHAILVLALFTWALPPLPAESQQPQLDETAAARLLVRKVQDDALYASWTSIECLRFMLEGTTSQHFDFAVRERHDGKCPDDPAVEPIVDRFRINRTTREILWYEAANGDYVAYARMKQRRKR